MLDAVLSTKGWGAREFATATPGFLAAARFALVAERHGPNLARLEATANQRVPFGLADEVRNAILDERLESNRAAILIRGALYDPETEEEQRQRDAVLASIKRRAPE